MANRIFGIALSGYRSFGSPISFIGPFGKTNLFAGMNNAGKSNILRFMEKHIGCAHDNVNSIKEMSPELDAHKGHDCPIMVGIALSLQDERIVKLRALLQPTVQAMLDDILTSGPMTYETSMAWMLRRYVPERQRFERFEPWDELAEFKSGSKWRQLWNAFRPRSSGGDVKEWIREVLETLSPFHEPPPKIALIPTIRQVTKGAVRDDDFSGTGLVEKLAQLQNPSHHQQYLRKKFDRVEMFVRDVVGNTSARLEIPFDREMIQIHMHGKVLPLVSLGTGLHQVIIMAAAATLMSDSLVAIEEPEVNLHPVLQRKLLTYLNKNTSNQYFISTHSAHLLDVAESTVFHVEHDENKSIVRPACNPHDLWTICRQLGYRASDILQSNCVIWVEGPSDRMYLARWIAEVEPAFVEGIHFTIMFYGGRLLSHLGANEPEVSEFISLQRMNRNLVILIDSDRSNERDQINSTKERVATEIETAGGWAWITHGREIENYIAPSVLQACVDRVHGTGKWKVGKRQFDRALPRKDSRSPDKVKVAGEVTTEPVDFTRFDLQARVQKLVEFIRVANH